MLATAVVALLSMVHEASGLTTSPVALVGGAAADDAAAVALESATGPCSGVVVAPRVVLTAAHCLGAAMVVHVGAAAPWDATVAVVAQHRHRRWVAGGSAYDLALVRLATPLAVAALPIRTADAAALTAVRVIGFGRTVAADPASAGVRRTAALTVAAADDAVLYTAATGSAFTCAGDSGGPALDGAGAVAALVVAGDPACAGASRLARVDREAAWIAAVIAAWDGPCAADGACAASCATVDPDCDPCGLDGTCAAGCAAPDLDCPLGGLPGEVCAAVVDCESRRCEPAPDDATTRYCTVACDAATPCPAPITACADGVCVYPGPTPGRLGAACDDDGACASGLCDRGLGVCAVRCGAGDACPADQACASTGQGRLCRPTDDGCSAGGRGGGLALALLITARAATAAAARRRRAR